MALNSKMNEGVRCFLGNLGMMKHYEIFCAKGFNLESDLPHLSLYDLEEILMIESSEERTIIFVHAQKFRPSAEYVLFEWLRRHSLDHYFDNFIQSELTDLKSVAKIQLPNEELYDELEIALPGHKKRLERAVASLRQEEGKDMPAETPVTRGWWGKPECLPQAKFDFLCVSANLFASHEPRNKVSIDFMVDSGSDISTVQENTLENLSLQPVGSVYSCGIHGGSHTTLYRAKLEIGEEQLDIEVMASNYDSLGSRIVRHFRHLIDGNRHIWLKGNYRDPLPAILPLAQPNNTSLPKALPSSLPPSTKILPPPTLSSSPTEKTKTMLNKNKPHYGNIPVSECKTELLSNCENTFHESPSQGCDTKVGKTFVSSGVSPFSSPIASKDSLSYMHHQQASKCLPDHEESETTARPEETISQKDTNSDNVTASNFFSGVFCPQGKKKRYPTEDSNTSHKHDQPFIRSSGGKEDINLSAGRESQQKNQNHQRRNDLVDKLPTNSLTLSQKRQLSFPSNDLAGPPKVQKVEDNKSLPPAFRDTDDDIDSVHPFLLDHPSGKSTSRSNDNMPVNGTHLSQHLHRLPAYEAINVGKSQVLEEENGEEVIHVLNQEVEEDVMFLEDNGTDQQLKYVRQNSNFLPSAGISVMIQLNDLEDD